MVEVRLPQRLKRTFQGLERFETSPAAASGALSAPPVQLGVEAPALAAPPAGVPAVTKPHSP